MFSAAQLSQAVSSPWVLAEPLFVFWLDIVYNERWLVNLFKCSCYFSQCISRSCQPGQCSQPAHPPSHMGEILRRCLSQSWMRLRGRKAASHRVRLGCPLGMDILLYVYVQCYHHNTFLEKCWFYCPTLWHARTYKLFVISSFSFSSTNSFHYNIQQMWWGGVGCFLFFPLSFLQSLCCRGLLKPSTPTGRWPVILSTGEVNKRCAGRQAGPTGSLQLRSEIWVLFICKCLQRLSSANGWRKKKSLRQSGWRMILSPRDPKSIFATAELQLTQDL